MSAAAAPIPNLEQLSPEQVAAMKNQLLACMQVLNMMQAEPNVSGAAAAAAGLDATPNGSPNGQESVAKEATVE